MKTLLEAIQTYPEQFISTLYARADTTPWEDNKTNHLFMTHWIKMEMWDCIEELLTDSMYRKPLEGVIFSLYRYSGIDNTAWQQIVELFEQEKFV